MKTDWNFGALEIDFDKEGFELEKSFDEFVLKWKDNKEYLENSKILKQALDEFNELLEKFGKGGARFYYYFLKQELDKNDKEIRKNYMLARDFFTKQDNKILFFVISLSKVSKNKQKEFLESDELADYRNFLKEIFENSKYFLSEKEEKILSLKSAGSYEMWTEMVEALLSKETAIVKNDEGNEVELTYPELIDLMRSTKKEVRDSANVAFVNILKKYEDVAEVELNAVLENAKVRDELRGYNRPDESRIKSDSIDLDFVDSILEASKEGFSISNKYYSLIAKLIGKEKIGYYERNVNIGKFDKKYSFEESVEIVRKVFSKLDKEFLDIFNEMLKNGKVDVYPKQGKNGGAFCVDWRRTDPTYVLLNHSGDLRDVTTIAHEMGHAINSILMKKNEKAINCGHPKSIAEVASNFMENFVFDEVLENSTKEEKFCLLVKKLGEDIASVNRQIALYLFELEIHKKYREEGYLSKEKIGEIFVKYMSKYLGESVDVSEANLWWIYWTHIREYFYVYSYASGILIAKSMQEKYKENNNFIEEVKKFLKTGTSKNPREIFGEMGIEINKKFFSLGVKSLEDDLSEIEKLANELGKFKHI